MAEIEGFSTRLEEAQFALELIESEAGSVATAAGASGYSSAAEVASIFQEAMSGLIGLEAALEVFGGPSVWSRRGADHA